MRKQDPPSARGIQFEIDPGAFVSEPILGTGIRLLRAQPETEATLAGQLEIPRRLELLRRQAPPHLTTPRLLQDDTVVGVDSNGAGIHLVLTSIVLESGVWHGGWFLTTVPTDELEAWQMYLAKARELFVREARPPTEGLP
jgi:hypothetical protein